MNINIIDTHAHLDMPEFDPDRREVIDRAREEGVTVIVTVGIDLASCLKALELTEQYPGIWAAVGVHPQETKGFKRGDINLLGSLAKHPRVVAIGELGLDFYRNYSPRENQLAALSQQLDLAKNLNLPIIVHCRQAQAEMLPILQNWVNSYRLPEGKSRGVLHCFSGDIDIAHKYLEMGFYISLGGYIGYPSSKALRDVIKSIPIDKIVIETDCPFLPPQKYRGKRNEPSYAMITAGVLADIRQAPLVEIASQTTQNAIKLFGLTGSS